MIFQDLIKQVIELNKDKGYWFVRTDSGLYFETFIKYNFIGIGWNQITVEDLTYASKTGSEVKKKIAETEKLDLKLARGKGKASSIYNKLKRFKDLRKGDLIIIPSNNSSRYAFGIIQDAKIFVDTNNSNNCEYYKRRKVKWLDIRNVNSLDPIFYQIKVSRHAISSVKKYENYIDNVTNSLYRKEGFSHLVLDINTKDDINVNTLINLVNSIQVLTKEINSSYSLNEDIDSSSIKLNLQSPGIIEFKLFNGKTLIILAAILSLVSCNDPDTLRIHDNDKTTLTEFVEVHQDTINNIENVINELEIDKEKINSIY